MRLIYPIAALLLIMFTACKKKNAATEKIKGDIVVRLTPPHNEYGNKQPFSISCRTMDSYECANFGIEYVLSQQGNEYEIKFTKIKKSEICLTAFGPATTNIQLDLKPGSYKLNFVLRGKDNRYTLTVNDGAYEIAAEGQSSNVTTGNNRVLAVPEHTLWGTMWDHTGDDMTNHYRWLDSALKSKGATPRKLAPGDYWSFSVNAQGNYTGVSAPNEIAYVYEYNGSFAQLKPMVEVYPDSVTVRLQNTEGEFVTN